MSKSFFTFAVAGVAAVMLGVSAQAAPAPTSLIDGPMLIKVSGGCGPYGYRGPYNGCRYDGRWRGGNEWGNGCPRGWWRGPWGHCRNTPYHGRLPGGGWK
jgi:hypothetical protein